MALDRRELLDPSHTAVLTMEMQRAVVGDAARLPHLADEVRARDVVPRLARLLAAARDADARVVHCTVAYRADRAGSVANCPLLAVMTRGEGTLEIGSPEADVVPELGPQPSDLVSCRQHGVSPFIGTSLDMTLRNLGVRTVVATGVSLNLGVLGMVIEAVNHGYRVAVATDAVAGLPRDYAEQVMEHTLALLATRLTVDEIIQIWDGSTAAPPRR